MTERRQDRPRRPLSDEEWNAQRQESLRKIEQHVRHHTRPDRKETRE
ncbi:MAG: hypothetical protein R6X33_00185 [Candidatus Brocadiia bacterium]